MATTKADSPHLLQSDDLKPEYIVFRDDLSFLESRLIDLEHILKNIEPIKLPPKNKILSHKSKDVKCYQNHTRNNIAVCKPQSRNSCKKRCTKYMNFSWEPKFIPAEELEKGDFVATPLSLDREMSNSPSIDYSLVKTEPRTFRPFKIIDKFVFKSDLLRLLGYYLA